MEDHIESASGSEWEAYAEWQGAAGAELTKLEDAFDEVEARSERSARILREVVRCVAERKAWEVAGSRVELEESWTPVRTPEVGTRVVGWETPPRMELGRAQVWKVLKGAGESRGEQMGSGEEEEGSGGYCDSVDQGGRECMGDGVGYSDENDDDDDGDGDENAGDDGERVCEGGNDGYDGYDDAYTDAFGQEIIKALWRVALGHDKCERLQVQVQGEQQGSEKCDQQVQVVKHQGEQQGQGGDIEGRGRLLETQGMWQVNPLVGRVPEWLQDDDGDYDECDDEVKDEDCYDECDDNVMKINEDANVDGNEIEKKDGKIDHVGGWKKQMAVREERRQRREERKRQRRERGGVEVRWLLEPRGMKRFRMREQVKAVVKKERREGARCDVRNMGCWVMALRFVYYQCLALLMDEEAKKVEQWKEKRERQWQLIGPWEKMVKNRLRNRERRHIRKSTCNYNSPDSECMVFDDGG